MKRRALLVRTITGAVSASVFTATGWLMGTRTLTMQIQNPCPAGCSGGYQYCIENCYTYPTPMCLETGCGSGFCQKWFMRQYGCSGDCSCYCLEEMADPQGCGSCNHPCLN